MPASSIEILRASELDGDVPLWRFMDFTKFVAMLHRRALFFARSDQMPDPFEGASADRRKHESRSGAGDVKRRVFLSCWHRNEIESAAMWRIYLSGEEGVALRTSASRLRSSISGSRERLLMGEVRYVDYERDPPRKDDELAPFFCKRQSFDFEREIRLVWLSDEHDDARGRYLPAALDVLIEQVVVSPDAEPWMEDLVRSVSEKYGFHFPVSASCLTEPPVVSRR